MIATLTGRCPACDRSTVRRVEVDHPVEARALPPDIFWHESCLGRKLRMTDTDWYWNCTYGCGQGGREATQADRDEAKATHEMVCPKNPVQPDDHPKGGGRK